MRNALNEVLRNEYIKDCQRGVDRWNKTIRDEGIDFELKLPSNRFHRQIGMWSTVCATPSGELIDRATWDAKKGDWLPDESDERYIKSLMKPASNPGQMASWIAAPAKGINGLPDDFVYVRD
jgi:benzoyl-CoA 2,3-dioxygenase component B